MAWEDAVRRRTSRYIGTALMLVLLAQSGVLHAAGGAPASDKISVFSPPLAPLLLTRTLHRPLPGGKAITTRRSYAVRIVRVGTGFRVEGELIDASVDAPPQLAALAEIERNRKDTGLFPILLDGQGQIVGGGTLVSDGSLDRAAAIAAQQIGTSGIAAVDMLQAQSFVRQIAARAPRTQWPADVFHPTPGRRAEDRVIAMPGGVEGHVTIEIAGEGATRNGQIALLERTVTTDLSGDTRVTTEQWQLVRQPRESLR